VKPKLLIEVVYKKQVLRWSIDFAKYLYNYQKAEWVGKGQTNRHSKIIRAVKDETFSD